MRVLDPEDRVWFSEKLGTELLNTSDGTEPHLIGPYLFQKSQLYHKPYGTVIMFGIKPPAVVSKLSVVNCILMIQRDKEHGPKYGILCFFGQQNVKKLLMSYEHYLKGGTGGHDLSLSKERGLLIEF